MNKTLERKRAGHWTQETPVGNDRGERRRASSPERRGGGRLVLLAPDRRLSLLDTAIELLSEVVTWSVLVWFERRVEWVRAVCARLSRLEVVA